MERISKQIYNHLMGAKKILLIPHQNPDGDAIGSVSAFSHFLRNNNKDHHIFCISEMPERLVNFPDLVQSSTDTSVWQDESFDTIVVLDSGDLKYAGIQQYVDKLKHNPTIINIDHHPTNQNFGHHNLVIPTASSTTQIIYQFLRHNNIPIDKKIALGILVGLVYDTENFTNPGTTSLSLSIASELMKRGANLNLIKDNLFKNKSLNALRLWGSVFSRLNKNEEFDIVYTYVTQDDLIKNQVAETEVEGIANFLNNLNEGKASLILKELPDNKVKGSFRTTRNDFDASLIAKNLGGGGHKKAAGFTIEGSIDSVLEKVWGALKNT